MKLHIQNIGPIGSADIELTGLTVIGGLNNTGKSTIGKCLFSIVKAIRNKELEYASAQRGKIDAIVADTAFTLRRATNSSLSPSTISLITRRFVDIDTFDIDAEGDKLGDILEELRSRLYTETIIRRSSRVRSSSGRTEPVENALEDDISKVFAILHEYTTKLQGILTTKKDGRSMYATSFENMLKSIFRGEVNNKRTKAHGTISLVENGIAIFNSTFQSNFLNNIVISEERIPELFEDATWLESPLVLNVKPSGAYYAGTYDSPYNGDYMTYDLLQKLSFATNSPSQPSLFDSPNNDNSNALEVVISGLIGKTINGRIYFDQQKDDFIFQSNDEDKVEVKIANTASGVKGLGIIQMLASAGILTGSNLLVIDEPEVHLHPAWQLVCAEVIAILVAKYNIYCLVSSHSPYFLQAIEEYARIYEMENLTKFYVSDKNTAGLCTFKDVTTNPAPLYDLLAEPMQRIAYLQTKEPHDRIADSIDE